MTGVGGRCTLVAMLSLLGSHPAAAQTTNAGWEWIRPQAMEQVGRTAHPRLAEVSGVAPSREHPGILWTINDSGNPPELLAIDTTGALLATFPLSNAPNIDWEDIALGPCQDSTCLYIADTGDNQEARSEVAIHRVVEPRLPATGTTGPTLRPTTLRVRYPDGPHDVEAMGVLPDGTILLVTKGRSGGILVFRLDAAAWDRGVVAVATRTDSLPIAASLGTGRVVTGLAISPGGQRAMVRTYRDLFPFAITRGGRTLRPLGAPTACDIVGQEPQGEAVGWLDDHRVVLLSERGLFREGTVFVVTCTP